MGKFGVQAGERSDLVFQVRSLAAQFQCPLAIVPDVRLFQLALNLDQPMLLAIKVKDTPVRPVNGPEDRAIY
jgi:hypothetical protein